MSPDQVDDIKATPICWQCGQNRAAVKLRLSICVVCAGIIEPPDKESNEQG